MSKFRKKPVVIDAFRWTGDEWQTEDPEWIILWHTDASASIPVEFAIQRIWPDSDYPELRTIAMVHPDPWELSKYRKENLYPTSIQARQPPW